ncbi:hypothetical protein [Cupriavidus taiwanensis]|uniref:hypothetical protein n=1 Tax=Cupriavidus taiwanensis TaxID=164546 RepID=UPI0004067785|nr:hypothetical protein [Cupriavidus taiwanensis]SOZ12068.1 putative Rz lysis protein [Cupriavidus taiwanensis]
MIQLNRLEAIALIVLALLAGITLGAPLGLWYGSSRATAIGDSRIAELKRQHTEADAKAIDEAAGRLKTEIDRGNRLSADLAKAEGQIDTLSQQLRTRVDRVTTVYREAPGAALKPLPVCIFTRGWLRDYNAAIGAAVPAAGEGASASSQAPAAGIAADGDDELAPAGIDASSILTHHIDYGARTRKLEEQLNRLIDFEEGKDAQ